MARIIQTSELDTIRLSSYQTLWVYNGLDCCITRELFSVLRGKLRPDTQLIYNFERALQAPVLEMMLRGVRVDQTARDEAIEYYKERTALCQRRLNQIAEAVWGKPLNPRSSAQLKKFFYEALKLKVIYTRSKGKTVVSLNRATLERLAKQKWAALPANLIMASRDSSKKLEFVQRKLSFDNRYRASFHVARTTTGRQSSSKGADGSGGNFQNWEDQLRKVFVSDLGMKFAYVDLAQAEARMVGALVYEATGDPSYLDACESGDLHTITTKLVWPELPWTGDPAADRAVAERKFYREYTYRAMSKKVSHGSNYYGKPFTLAVEAKVETKVMEDAQERYFKAFPRIRTWHAYVIRQLQLTGTLTTPLGRTRRFFGRLSDEDTWKKAIAYIPQSSIADILNLGLFRVWQRMKEVQVLIQLHDAILIQYPEDQESTILSSISSILTFPFTIAGREVTIPCDIQVGWNWAHQSPKHPEDNPDGLVNWSGDDTRQRKNDPSLPMFYRGVF